jgi:hypothetical protein
LYRVEKERGQWKAVFTARGNIKPETQRAVAISDSVPSIEKAADGSGTAITKSPVGKRHAENMGFDMHYTPGTRRIGSLLNYRQARNAENDPALHESAILLARTMANASKVEHVMWVTDQGGSGVLTQALKILATEGVRLESHSFYLSCPTTPPSKLIPWAAKVGLKFEDKIRHNNILWPSQLVNGQRWGWDGFTTIRQRKAHQAGYTNTSMVIDGLREVGNLKTLPGAVVGVAGAVAMVSGVLNPVAAVGAALSLSTHAQWIPAVSSTLESIAKGVEQLSSMTEKAAKGAERLSSGAESANKIAEGAEYLREKLKQWGWIK